MKQILVIVSTIIISINTFAQGNIDSVLNDIEKNNTSLTALKEHIKAEKLGNKTGLTLNNPEAEFNYLWGSPSVIGNRTNISISQSFDFPTAYIYKKQMANMKNQQIELEYKKQLSDIKLEVRNLCNDLIFYNALLSEIKVRLEHAESIAESYKIKFETGEINIIEFNKAQLNLVSLNQEYQSLLLKKKFVNADLTAFNGGLPIEFNDSTYQEIDIPEDFEKWYQTAKENNPILNWLKQEIDINQHDVKLNKAMSLPKFHAGYMSEKLTDEQFQGITFGLTIPIWENKNKTKYAKMKKLAAESLNEDKKIQYYNNLKKLHNKAFELQIITDEFKHSVSNYNSTELLKKALDAGEINLIDYLLELSVYYQTFNTLLESERNLHKTIAELVRYI